MSSVAVGILLVVEAMRELYHINTTYTPTQTLECEIANPTDLETERLLTVTVRLGNQVQLIGMILIRIQMIPINVTVTVQLGSQPFTLATNQINEPVNLLVILIPVFAGVIVLSGAIFVMVVAMLCWKTRQKAREKDKLLSTLVQMEHRETETASESVRGEQHQNCNA